MKEGYYFVKYRDKWEIVELMSGGDFYQTGSDRGCIKEEFDEIGEFIGGNSDEIEESNREIGIIRVFK